MDIGTQIRIITIEAPAPGPDAAPPPAPRPDTVPAAPVPAGAAHR